MQLGSLRKVSFILGGVDFTKRFHSKYSDESEPNIEPCKTSTTSKNGSHKKLLCHCLQNEFSNVFPFYFTIRRVFALKKMQKAVQKIGLEYLVKLTLPPASLKKV